MFSAQYLPEDDDKDTIISISFSNDGKVVNYFIQFTTYQNHIHWDNCSLQKVVKDALPIYIRDELRFSHKDILSFEGLKRAMMRIDNNYWKCQQEEKNKLQTACILQNHTPRLPNPSKGPPTPDRWS